jgi:selenide,water dikinase
MSDPIRLTQYSHGAGCGCKIAPDVLETILKSELKVPVDPSLIVGHNTRDDAAVYDLGNGTGVISTTDFFMPIVDDPFDFGRVAATNAMSDVYAMGGRPLMAIAVLGWPLGSLPAAVAGRVVDGGRQACLDAGFQLAGGHSIDAPEPIFGLAVTGTVDLTHLKRNDSARAGNLLYLTKPLGIGIYTTAEKQGKLAAEHHSVATETMCQINTPGEAFGTLPGVTAMTDVTGFGLMGHLLEMCEGSQLQARIEFSQLPRLPSLDEYIQAGCVPGGTGRNFSAYGHKLGQLSSHQRSVICDPQTSGGLLVAVDPDSVDEFLITAGDHQLDLAPIGEFLARADEPLVTVL